MRAFCRNSLLGIVVAIAATAQAPVAAELGATSFSFRLAPQAARVSTYTLPSPTKQIPSPHMLERSGPPPDEVNRKEFEANAGVNAGKLFLRSVPTGADVFVDGLLVGKTPLLMVIAPGPYKIEMRGSRDDSGHANVGVMPKETRAVTIELKQRYPSSISLR